MDKGQFAILRFAKYKGPEISNIEAHNERTKEKYASNPDVDVNRSNTFWALVLPNHLINPFHLRQYQNKHTEEGIIK